MFNMLKREKDANCDSSRDMKRLVESRGFLLEEHKIATADHYVLTIHRIVNPFVKADSSLDRGPVLLQHGLASNSIHWLIASKDGHVESPLESHFSLKEGLSGNIGFELANRGFDVWLGNNRGNAYAKVHKFLEPSQQEFWDFSMDEMIEHDLPATIDHILQVTSRKSLAYIGMSQGTAIMFGLLSSKVDYNDKIKPYIALAPLVRYTNCTSLARFAPSVLLSTIGRENGLALACETVREWATGHFLEYPVLLLLHFICFCIFGFNYQQVDFERLKVIYSHPIGDLSWKTLRHHNQLFLGERFQKFDYGLAGNVDNYGSVSKKIVWFLIESFVELIVFCLIRLFHRSMT